MHISLKWRTLFFLIACLMTLGSPIIAADNAHTVKSWSPWMEETASLQIDAKILPTLLVEPLLANASVAWADHWNNQNPADKWSDLTIEMILKYRVNPLRAGRALTLVNVVQHDALILAIRHSLGPPGRQAAVHLAAANMLAQLFPLESPGHIAALGAIALAATEWRYPHPQAIAEISMGREIAQRVAAIAIIRAQSDRSDEVWDARNRPKPAEGIWQSTPPLESAQPQEALAGQWRTWVLRDGAYIQPTSPPASDSAEVKKATREVLEVFRHLTPAQKKIADDWHLDQGSATPPGVWNLKARALADKQNFSNEARTQMYAALNVAMMDAAIACWHAKYTWWTARPITLIREQMAPNFLPYLVTPPHPSYTSGHASVSGAASEVLKKFFPDEQKSIDQWAEEAAMSRLYGGIHFRHDNEAGLVLGRKIGQLVVTRLNQ